MNDDFTTAAWEHWESHPDRLTATPSMAYGIAAEWARDHLAAQDATDAERAVRDLHREVVVYELDSVNGTWVYGEDDERVVLHRYCAECSSEDVIHAVEDQDWMEDWGYAWEVPYPCPTIRALSAARAVGRDAR